MDIFKKSKDSKEKAPRAPKDSAARARLLAAAIAVFGAHGYEGASPAN